MRFFCESCTRVLQIHMVHHPKGKRDCCDILHSYCAHVDSGSAHDLELSALRGAVFSTFFQGAISIATRPVKKADDTPSKFPLALDNDVNIYVSSLSLRYGWMLMSNMYTKVSMAIGTARSNLNLLYSIVKYVSETEKSAGSSLAELISVTDEELAIKDSDIIAEVHEYGSMTHSAFVYRAALDASAPNMTPLQICPDIISEVLQCVSMGANLAEWGPKTWMCSYSRWEVQQYLVAYTVAKLMADRLDIHLEKNETGNTAVEYPDCGRLLTDFSNSLNAVPARPFCRVWGFTAMYELFGERHMLFARYLDANSRDAKPENICVLDELRPCFELDSLCKDRYEVICNTTDSIRGMLLDIAAIECSRMCEDTIIMRLLTTKVVREAFNMMLSNPDSAFKDLKCSD